MRYVVDHDMHIHSQLSYCSSHKEQTKDNILKYAQNNGLKRIIVTDHFWEKEIPNKNEFYVGQDYERVTRILPLPQADGVEFLFGVEADMDENCVIGIDRKTCEKFDFVIVPTTHMHMYTKKEAGLDERREIFIKRFEALLSADLPFEKIGLAHITCPCIWEEKWQYHIDVINSIPDSEFERLFKRAAELGMGIEINMPVFKYTSEELDMILRPYRIAKNVGCKFYFGSDSHTPEYFVRAKEGFEYLVDKIGLEESDKFILKV